MKPVDQAITNSNNGDCFRACIASLLEFPLERVPNFMDAKPEEWFEDCAHWCMRRGFNIVDWHISEAERVAWILGGYYIASGPGPRGCLHSVVYLNGEMVHDPHISRDGIDEITHVTLLVPLNPAGIARPRLKCSCGCHLMPQSDEVTCECGRMWALGIGVGWYEMTMDAFGAPPEREQGSLELT